jgi:hypothetical protein
VIAVVAALVVAAAIVTFSAVYTYGHVDPPRSTQPPQPAPPHTAPPPQAAPTDLAAEFAQLAARMNAQMGLAVAAVDNGQSVTIWGDWQQGPAWSTIKVPLVIAAYRQQHEVTDKMKAAITESDNAAAEALWAQLGDPPTAAQQVQQILQETGDPTTVESRRLRTEFTAFGQTIWSLTNQVRFTAGAFCNPANAPIFDLMGQVEPQQTWGIGTIPGAQFKGGWGPSTSGKYLVRQIGVLNTPHGKVAVAIAAEPASGSFDDGKRALDEAATWLTAHLAQLPAGQCKS